ncbi:MAG: DUF2530 domain-containing protein [Aquiluna sp.]|jgi:uncharacterized membrane protein
MSDQELDPVKVNIRLVLAIGTVAWLVALIILAAFYQSLANAGLDWWLHTAAIGALLGGIGLLTVRS